MKEWERMAGVFGGVGVVLVTLLMGLRGDTTLPAMDEHRPLVGRTQSDVAAGPVAEFRHIRATTDEDREAIRRSASLSRFARTLVGDPRPVGFRRIVVHPFVAELPDVSVEDGPPWHLIVELDGRVTPTPRWRKGRAGAPPGLPVRAALKAIHVAVPFAAGVVGPRHQVLMDLFEWLRRRLGGKASVQLASDVPGATATLPEGAARKDLLPER